MNIKEYRALKDRVRRLKGETQTLRKKIADLRKEIQSLQRALRESRGLIDHIPGAVVLIQEDKVILTNEKALQKLGYSEEEFLGQNFLHFVHPRSHEYVRNINQKRLSGKHVPDQYEAFLGTKAGDSLLCEVRVRKIRHHGRKAFLLNIVDISEWKQREMASIRVMKMEAVSRIASGMGREFNACLGLLDDALYSNGKSPMSEKEHAKFLRTIEAMKERGHSLTQSLDLLADVKHDRTDVVPFDLKGVVNNAVALSRPDMEDIGARGVTVNLKTYQRAFSPVEGRPREIQDVISAMISNAIDALPPEGGEIYLTTEEDSGYAFVYIQDNGTGIPDDVNDKIFDPFFTTKGNNRPGLGLSLAQAIISRHRGQIEVISREGEGSTFITKIPLAQENSKSKVKRPQKRIRDSHILFIPEDGVVKGLLSQLFVGMGCKVVSTSVGMRCLKLLRKNKFDMLIADLSTAPLESFNIIPKIREVDQSLPIIALVDTVKKDESNSLKGFGADFVIGKPFEIDRILSLVSEVLVT